MHVKPTGAGIGDLTAMMEEITGAADGTGYLRDTGGVRGEKKRGGEESYSVIKEEGR